MIKWKAIKKFPLIMGILLVHNALWLIIDPTWTSKYGLVFDVSEYKVPWAVSGMTIGLYSLWVAFKDKAEKGQDILICRVCNSPHPKNDVKDNKCPKCHVDLEPLEGFYDRHPELRDKK